MRIRTRLLVTITLSLALGLVAALLVAFAAIGEREAGQAQASAQLASHEVSGLLVLTQEYARYAESRSAQQWRFRHGAISAALEGATLGGPALVELRAATLALPPLFSRLEELPADDDPFTLRRREMLIDQLLTSTQAMSDFAYQWYQDAAERRAVAEQRFQLLAMACPVTMLCMLVAIAWQVRGRVLAPLKALNEATAAVSRGDLSVKIHSAVRDEFGDLSRQFDDMTLTLASSEARLRRSERQLQAVTDNLPTFIAHVDREGRFTFANAHHERVLGLSPERMLGTHVRDAVGPVAYAAMEEPLQAAFAGEQRQFEWMTGSSVLPECLLTEFIPDVAEDGSIAGVYAMALDITPLKAAHQAHARGEERLRVITDNLPALIAHVGTDERYTFANAQVSRFVQRGRDAIVGKTVREVRGEEAYARVQPHIRAALAGETRTHEGVVPTPQGDVYYQATYIPDVDADGTVRGYYTMSFDITERKQAELMQSRSEARVRDILTHAPDAFISIDADSLIREWNRRAEETFGWTREEVLGRPLADTVIPQGSREGHNAGMRRFVHTGTGPVVNQRIETLALHKDGRTIPIELSVAAVRDGSGYAANAFLRDISERKTAEDLLRSSERRLRDLTDNMPAMVGYFDDQERCLFANASVLKAHGLTVQDTTHHTLRSGIGEESYALHEPHVRRALQGEASHFEGHLRRRGRDVHFQAYLIPDVDAEGKARGFYVMTFDISGVRQAEIERARSEKLLRQITDNLPVLISYVDRDQRMRFANETYRNWLGADPQALVGTLMRDVVGEALYEPRRANIERALAGHRVEFEGEAVTLGTLRSTHTVYIPDVDADGTVRGVYTLTSDVSALKAVERQLQALARFDTLTGLPNRLQFNERLQEALARSERNNVPVALMFLDVDHFKSINDTRGHAAGDAVLKAFASRLVSSVRATDTVARLAGDEFVIILEGLHGADEVDLVARKIVSAVAAPMPVDGADLRVTTSLGAAFHDPAAGGVAASHLLDRADGALYAAKQHGRNTYRVVGSAADAARA